MALSPQAFFGVPYRTVVTTLNGQVVTFLDRLASDRRLEMVLDTPTKLTAHVPSDHPEVNLLRPEPDARPFVSFSDRLLFFLRRDEVGSEATPSNYTCRGSGIMMPVQDEGLDSPVTTFTAFDPWQLLYKRPVITNGGVLPGPNGWIVRNRRADQIVMDLLNNQAVFCAANPHADAFIDRGQGLGYAGTVEATGVVEAITFAQGSSVGEAFDLLCEARYCDIVLTPIYDPLNRPGLISELSVYESAGTARNDAILAWDKPSRSLVSIDALYDGGELENKAKTYPGQGGPPVPVVTDAASAARYGEYWVQKFFTGQDIAQAVELLTIAEVRLQRDGKRTLRAQPTANRSPIVFVEYGIGDYLPVYASDRLRQPIAPTQGTSDAWIDAHRVWGIDVTLGDDDLETVDLLLTQDA